MYSCDGNTELQSSVSHDPSQIILICWFVAQETLLLLLLLMLNIFVESFSGFFEEYNV